MGIFSVFVTLTFGTKISCHNSSVFRGQTTTIVVKGRVSHSADDKLWSLLTIDIISTESKQVVTAVKVADTTGHPASSHLLQLHVRAEAY